MLALPGTPAAMAQGLLPLPGAETEASEETPDERLESALSALAATVRAEDIDELIAMLNGLREALVQSGAAEDAEAQPKQTLLEFYEMRFEAMVQAAPSVIPELDKALTPANGSFDLLSMLVAILALWAIGFAGMWFARQRLMELRVRLRDPTPSLRRRVLRRIARFGLDLIEIGVFVLMTGAAYLIWSPEPLSAFLFQEMVLEPMVVILVIARLSRLLLSPHDAQVRSVPLSDAAAGRLHRIIVGFASMLYVMTILLDALREFGVPEPPLDLLAAGCVTIIVLVLTSLVWAYRGTVEAAIVRAWSAGGAAVSFARAWPVLGTFLAIVVGLLTLSGVLRDDYQTGLKLLISLGLMLAVPALAYHAKSGLRRLYKISAGENETMPAPGENAESAGDAAEPDQPVAATPLPEPDLAPLMRSIWVVLVVLTLAAVLQIWGLNPVEQVGIAGTTAGILFHALTIALLSYVAYELIRTAIDRRMAHMQAAGDDSRARRLLTLLPLVRTSVMVILVVLVLFVVLAELGINIAPLLAGAGVLGIAFGLGAQALVTDVIAGVFFLIDDAFRVGDYIETDNLRGHVEHISLRSLRVRHHRGAVHTIPFGQIRALSNYSRDWTKVRFELAVAPETDTMLVKRIVKQIGKEIMEDPELGPSVIEPLKSQGPRRIENNTMILSFKFIAKPGEQFGIQRVAYERIKKAFAENGIEFAAQEVTVRVHKADEVSEEEAGAAAAARTIQQREEELAAAKAGAAE
ncbi:MAG: mechanosensitive ion channel family protein [Alphaproteobacteria bacterium]|nr:mechanosensitive ion channel family protein [Alphaproteobacteria bacterium]